MSLHGKRHVLRTPHPHPSPLLEDLCHCMVSTKFFVPLIILHLYALLPHEKFHILRTPHPHPSPLLDDLLHTSHPNSSIFSSTGGSLSLSLILNSSSFSTIGESLSLHGKRHILCTPHPYPSPLLEDLCHRMINATFFISLILNCSSFSSIGGYLH